jgi:8-oxo-dGTP pyrophosphatase MutT (NUDIX family)
LTDDEHRDDDHVFVHCQLVGRKLVLLRAADPVGAVQLQHLPECPMKERFEEAASGVEAGRRVGVDAGVVAVVESSDQHVLLTRRAAHMRTFPGLWVPPGGGMEDSDLTLLHAGLRELREETGLRIDESADVVEAKVLCLWESVFPPLLMWGNPRRHHVVVYYHVVLRRDHLDLDGDLRLEPKEVDASAWLSRSHVSSVVSGYAAESQLKETFRVKQMRGDGSYGDEDRPLDTMLAGVPASGADVERVSTGTKFALWRWLVATEAEASSKL